MILSREGLFHRLGVRVATIGIGHGQSRGLSILVAHLIAMVPVA